MIDFSKIDTWSNSQEILRAGSRPFLFRMFFKKVTYEGFENIPKNRPVIFALNHQNALMDALVVVQRPKKEQTVFLARADIFKKDRVAKILRWLKIMPVFRIRDGASNLSKNDAIFERTADILKAGNKLGMMPEGNHGDKKRLRKLNKGLCRIAFKAQEKFKDQPGVVIVPTGIDYSHYENMRTNVLVKFGKPIEVADFWNSFEENQPVAFNNLLESFRDKILNLMIHIETDEYYNNYIDMNNTFNNALCRKLKLKANNYGDKFRANKQLVEKLDVLAKEKKDEFVTLQNDFSSYTDALRNIKLTDKKVANPGSNVFRLIAEHVVQIITLPIYILGLINGILPYGIAKYVTNKNIKDPQFKSTFRYVLSLIIFLVINVLIMVPLVIIFMPFWWLKIIYLVTMPFTMIFAFNYYVWSAGLFQRWKICFLKLSGNKKFKEVSEMRQSIEERILKLF